DLVAAHVLALGKIREGASGLKLNLATGSGASVKQVIAAAERVTGKPVPYRIAPRRPGDPPELVADPREAERILGWKARYGLEDMVRHAWAFRCAAHVD